MSKHVLVLGTTGVDKRTALGNLKKYREDKFGQADFVILDLEEYILEKNRIEIFDFLDAEEDQQVVYWLKGWNELKNRSNDYKGNNILLCMHAVLARRSYGFRSPIIIESIVKDFKPTEIITLIDDVYLCWSRTQERAEQKRQEFLGKPTIEQLLQARRAEILLGDLIAKQITKEPPFSYHFILPIWHPARVLDRIIFRDPLTSYLSFPISKPRELKSEGDPSGEREINGILKKVSNSEMVNENIALFCPLTIDEYPLLKAPINKKMDKKAGEEKSFRLFRTKNRWNVRAFYGNEILLIDDSKLPEKIKIPIIDKVDEVREVEGMIRTDVGLRDYRLIRQSDRMAVFNPVFKTIEGEFKFSKGVLNEIEYANQLRVPVYVYQNPDYDPNGLVSARFKTESKHVGGATYGSEYIYLCPNLATLIDAISR